MAHICLFFFPLSFFKENDFLRCPHSQAPTVRSNLNLSISLVKSCYSIVSRDLDISSNTNLERARTRRRKSSPRHGGSYFSIHEHFELEQDCLLPIPSRRDRSHFSLILGD